MFRLGAHKITLIYRLEMSRIESTGSGNVWDITVYLHVQPENVGLLLTTSTSLNDALRKYKLI